MLRDKRKLETAVATRAATTLRAIRDVGLDVAAALRPPASTGFVLRTLLAYAMALYAAYALELDSPYSAGTTVLIVANSSRGAVLSKGFWRIAGSLAGAIAAVVLVALFAQAPVLFIFGLALWLGLCTFAASLLRYFRSYGVVLAGYTVVLVGLGALTNPDRIFIIACGRLAVVTLGVLASGLVSMITDWGPSRRVLAGMLGKLTGDAARLLVDAPNGGLAFPATRSRIATELTSLDQAVEYAAVEDAGFSGFARDMRLAAAELFSALTGGRRASILLAQAAAEHPGIASAADAVTALLNRIAALDPRRTAPLRHDIGVVRDRLVSLQSTDRPLTALSALEQATVLLDQFAVALDVLEVLHRGVPGPGSARLPLYANPTTALRNGVRAFLAVAIAGLFWIVSQWSSGGTMLAALGPMTGLLAQQDSAAAASIGFFRGMMLAVVAAFICTFGLLPQVIGFPLLLAVMMPFLAAGLAAGRWPKLLSTASPFLIFFNSLCATDNPMRYDALSFFNSAAAFILGAGCTVLTFRVLLPPNPVREAAVLTNSIRAAVLRLVRRPMPARLPWEHLQHQKLVRLSRRLAADPARRQIAIERAGGAVLIGRRIGQLRRLARDGSVPPQVVSGIGGVLDAMGASAFPLAAERAERAAADLAASEPPAPLLLPVAAALHDLATLLAQYGGFLAAAA